ncbi:zf-HC2 domain-containing protein [Archangium sp.]|uniref:zf-HC2 domain-containing protein n=1 Tax=Archangium sp. TaxID=1872627 RepID=UPI00389A6A75
MKPQGAHAHEDRLLDFAYGELPPSEARLVEQHVEGCSRCTEALDGIRGVRTTMSRLSLQSAPDAGLESLLAYAQQSARRSAAGPEPEPRWWRRLLAPAMGVAALSVFGVVVVQVNREVDLRPALKQEAPREPATRNEDKAVAASEAPASPAGPAPTAAPAPAAVSAETGKLHEQMDEKMRDELSNAPMATKASPQPARRAVQQSDWSNAGAGSGGGFPAKKSAAYADKESSGLEGLGTRAPSKLERGSLLGKGAPSTAMAEREAEPVAQEAMAAADVAGPAEEPLPGESQAAQYAPPSPKQEIIGSASRPAMGMSKDAMGDDAQPASPRAQVANASPPPPPPAPAQYQPPAAAASGAYAQLESAEAKKSDVARKPAAKSAGRIAPSLSELLRQADVARRSGDREQEVAFLRAALTSGAQGSQLVDVLSRLCDAETALGNRRNAIELCKRVTRVAPGSSEARLAQRRLEGELRSADEADSEPKAASPAMQ